LRDKSSLTLQEVELAGGGVEAHEVEAAGGPAATPLTRCLPGGQTLQHAALPGPVQTQDQDLTLPTLLLLLQVQHTPSDTFRLFINTSIIQHCMTNEEREERLVCLLWPQTVGHWILEQPTPLEYF